MINYVKIKGSLKYTRLGMVWGMNNKINLFWISLLSFTGGYINVFGILTVALPLSHFSGGVAKLSIEAANGFLISENLAKLLTAIFCFLIGNIFSGIVVGERNFSFRKRYGLIFIGMGLIILYFNHLFLRIKYLTFLLSIFVGVQNGLFITYRGILVRTSHITGTLSDLGVYIGYIIRGKKVEAWRMFYYINSLMFFFLGGVMSAIAERIFKEKTILIISVLYIIIGLIYLRLRHLFEKHGI